MGIKSTVPLLSTFVAVCAAECVAGGLLWHNRRSGAVLSLALLPVESGFWVGFALPIPPAFAAVRTGSVLWNRSSWEATGYLTTTWSLDLRIPGSIDHIDFAQPPLPYGRVMISRKCPLGSSQ